jgi:hypothetical protein
MFRSLARIIVGESCEWNDLAARGPSDKDAVRELTRRIDASMRAVTLNLHDWRDEQLVRAAEGVWHAEFGASHDPRDQMKRLRVTADALARLRLGGDADWRRVARELRSHDRILARLGLTPDTLNESVSSDAAFVWALKRLPMLVMSPLAGLGLVLFWVPRELAGAIGARMAMSEGEDAIPTFRVLYGGPIFLVWFLLLAFASSFVLGAVGGVIVFVALPVVAFGSLIVGESRRLSWAAMRRFFTLRLQRDRVSTLRARQHALAERLRELLARA